MTGWLLLNSLGLLLQAVVLYLVLRQVGFVLRRIGPVGARGTSEGPRIGENISHQIPEILATDLRGKAKLVVFVSHECSICRVIRDGAVSLARTWRRDACIILIYDSAAEVPLRSIGVGLYERRAAALRTSLGANFVPFAVVTNDQGVVLGKGLVNDIGHMESLLELQRANATGRAVEEQPTGLTAGSV